jgi:hypothetical protein
LVLCGESDTRRGLRDDRVNLTISRSMYDADGPLIAQWVYEALFEKESLDLKHIPYVLDEATQRLRLRGVPASRWATFMHMGA